MDYKEYREAYEQYPKECFVSQYPLTLDIELTNRCNRTCKMCPYHGDKPIFKQDPCDMNFELYKKIIDEGVSKGLQSIKINFGGEPLLYKRIVEAVWYARKKGIIDVRINTNGDKLDKLMSKDLLEAGLTVLILSDYGDHNQLCNGIIFNILRLKYPECEFHVNKTENPIWNPIADVVDPPIYYDFSEMKDNLEITDFKCTYPWLRMLVMADGTCLSCSCSFVSTDMILGNVRNTTIEEMWNGEIMSELRNYHENGLTHLPSYCRKCGIRNDWIEKGECRM